MPSGPGRSTRNDCLISLRDLPPKEEKHINIYGLSAVIYKKSLLPEVLKWPLVFKEWNSDGMMQATAIDTFVSDYTVFIQISIVFVVICQLLLKWLIRQRLIVDKL